MAEPLLIRKGVASDLEKVHRIAQVLYLDIPGFVWHDQNFIRGQIEKGEYYVAVPSEALAKEGRIVGIMSLRDRNGMLYIETLAVDKDSQSKGVGKKLVEFAKQFAEENNYKILRTTSFYEYGVQDFWLKQGFRRLWLSGKYNDHKFHRLEMKI